MGKLIQNLGQVLTVLAKHEAWEVAAHMDVDAWGAPGECHADVSRGEAKRFRMARRQAEALAHRPFRTICREASKRGMPIGSPKFDRLVGRCIAAINLPY